ncbi:MAG: HD domain-containing protein [Candidatus Bilamarchaeaceae archaeon]
MIINDDIHGNIEFSETERRIIDTHEFQFLRGIKQMAFAYLVYPGSLHTRFEHSLGTLHLATRISRHLGVQKEDLELIRLHALLHDLGHLAFSHESERVLSAYLGDHERVGEMKAENSAIKDIISENLSVKDVKGIFHLKEKAYERIIDSDLGADRMDYLLRDSRNTGVAYGIVDIDRLIHTLALDKKELALKEGGIEAAESLLIARFMMFSAVYLHDTARVASAMFRRAVSLSVETKEVQPKEFLYMNDWEALDLLKSHGISRDYALRLESRRLYKVAGALPSVSGDCVSKLEAELSDTCGCDIIIDEPVSAYKPISFKINYGGKSRNIDEVSELVASLKTTEEKRSRALVCCPAENRENVAKHLG